MSEDQNPSDKACDAYFDNPYAATSGSYYSDRVTFHAGFAAGAASRDAEIAELVAALKPFGAIDLVESRLPAEFAMFILRARAAIAKVRKP
jgi:hypothetical protein